MLFDLTMDAVYMHMLMVLQCMDDDGVYWFFLSVQKFASFDTLKSLTFEAFLQCCILHRR